MRSILVAVLAAAALMLVANRPAAAQATTSANASATIVTAISLTKTADLDFGNVVASGSAGTVVLTAAGSRSVTGGASLGNSGRGVHGRGSGERHLFRHVAGLGHHHLGREQHDGQHLHQQPERHRHAEWRR